MQLQSVGIIGYGAFGAFLRVLITRFAPGVSVRVSSSSHEPDGAAFFSFEDTCACDAVIFAVPIRAFEEVLGRALEHMRPDAVIVDIATVKVHTVEVLKRLAGGRPYIATHPMFGPESYTKTGGDVAGYRIVIADHTLQAGDYASLLERLRHIGFEVVETTADQHDKQLAETLFLTHFIGQVITRAGFERTAIDTVSFGFLMKAVEIVRVNTELFKDVFRFNPYCEGVLERLEAAEQETHALLQS